VAPLITRLTRIRDELVGVTGLITNLLVNTTIEQMVTAAPSLWEEIQTTLGNVLINNGPEMDSLIIRGGVPDAEQGRHMDCQVCFSSLPNIMLEPCHHALCITCSYRITLCPFCRVLILGRIRITF
jgi:hypothetical protein